MVDHLLVTRFLLALLARAFLLACSWCEQASKGPIPTHKFRTPCPAIPQKRKVLWNGTFPTQNTIRPQMHWTLATMRISASAAKPSVYVWENLLFPRKICHFFKRDTWNSF
jgi:hypothetical protein